MSSSTPPSAPNSGNKKISGSKNTPLPPPSARETREPSPSAHNNLDSNSNSNANANSRTSAPPQQPKQKPVPSPRPPTRRASIPPSNPSNSKPLLTPPRINSNSNSSSNSSSSSEPRPAPSQINSKSSSSSHSKSNSSSHSNSNSNPLPPLNKSNSNSTTSDTFEPLAAVLPGPDYDDPTVVVPSLSENKTPTPTPPTYISSPVSEAPPGPSIIVPSEYADSYRDMTPPSTGERSMSRSSDTRALVGGGIVILIILFFVVIVKWRRSKTDQLLVTHANPSPKPATVLSYRQGYNNPTVLTTDPFFGQPRISTSSRTRSLTPSHPSGSSHAGPYHPTTPTCENNSARANFSLSFTYEEIVDMTGNFSQDNLIGEGGFGCVYKGWMPDGRSVAVKLLKVGNRQGEIEFRAEVETIGRIHHRHLVSLVGYCVVDNHRALVYEFLPNCTLDFHLHGKGVPAIDWERRVKIAVGTVRGLAYLHEECQPRIIHRDIKSANILLDYAFEPQVADFGLTKLTIESLSHASSHIMGTFGYIAPEYASSGKLTDRSDVFSFGVVLLELITGRKPVDTSQPPGHESLVDWARPLLVHALETGEIQGLVDPRLGKNYDYEEMFRMIEAAAACVRHNAIKRPRMIQVKRALVSDGNAMDLANGSNVGQGMAFDCNQYPPNEMQRYRQVANSMESSGEFEQQTHRLSNSSGTPRKPLPLSHVIRP